MGGLVHPLFRGFCPFGVFFMNKGSNKNNNKQAEKWFFLLDRQEAQAETNRLTSKRNIAEFGPMYALTMV